MSKQEQSEQEQLRNSAFQCLKCGDSLLVGSQYPHGMIIPRTLELWCRRCELTNILYQPAYWATEKKAA